MELSELVAQIISVIYIVSGIGVVWKKLDLKEIAEELLNSNALSFFSGSLGIIFGIILINYHNIWTWQWNILITLISWFFLVGGVLILWFPKLFKRLIEIYKNSIYYGIFMIAFGLLFGYFGFFYS